MEFVAVWHAPRPVHGRTFEGLAGFRRSPFVMNWGLGPLAGTLGGLSGLGTALAFAWPVFWTVMAAAASFMALASWAVDRDFRARRAGLEA